MRPWLALAVALLALPVACGDDDDDSAKVCAPGKAETCTCPGGTPSSQACKADGTGYEACQCGAAGGGGSGGGASGAAGSGGGSVGGSGGGDRKGCVRTVSLDATCEKKSKATPIAYLQCDVNPPDCTAEANLSCCPLP